MVIAALDLQRPQNEILKIVGQSLAAHPDYWETSYTFAHRLLPKWGGSWSEYDSYVVQISRLAKPERRDEVYASHYWQLVKSMEFQSSNYLNWTRVKAGLTAMMDRMPEETRYLNAYAALACMSNDGTTYSSARRRIKEKGFSFREWPQGVSMDVCDRRFKLNEPL